MVINMKIIQHLVTVLKNEINSPLLRFTLLFTLCIGFATYGFGYYNLGFSHDSLSPSLQGQGEFQLTIGRPFTSYIFGLFEYYNNKPIMGLISLLFIALSVYTTVNIFSKILCFDEKSKKYLTIAVSLLYTLNVAFIALNATYSFQICSDTLALLCSVYAVYFVCDTTNIKKICFSVVLCTISICLYQAYIDVFLTLFIIVLIIKLARGNSVQSVIKTGLIYFCITLLASVMYLGIWKLLMFLNGVNTPQIYNNPENVGFSSFGEIAYYLIKSLKHLKDSLIRINSFNITIKVLFNIICMITLLFAAIRTVNIVKGIIGKLLVAVLCVLFVLCLNIANIVSKDVYHNLMTFSFCLVNVLAFVALLKSNKECLIKIFMVWLAVISFHCCNFYNTISMMKVLELNATYSHFSRILQRIESLENFSSKNDIIVIEPFYKSEYLNNYTNSIFLNHKVLVGCKDLVAGNYNSDLFASYFNLGLKTINLSDESVLSSLKLSKEQIEEINKMSPYPDVRSVKRVGKYIFVKTSTEKYYQQK